MKLLDKIKNNTSLFNIILLLSPFMDIFICFMQKNNLFALGGTIIRGVFLLFLLLYVVFFKKDKDSKLMWYIIILGVYISLFLINQFILNASLLSLEIKTIIKYMFYPLILSCFLLLNSKNPKNINDSLFLCAIIYGFFLLMPFALKLNYNSYANIKQGNIGWFYSPNEISAIVSILCPFVIYKMINEKKFNYKIIYTTFTFAYLYTILQIGTKTPFLAILITLLMYIIKECICLFTRKEKRNYTNIILLAITVIFSIFVFKFGFAFSNIVAQEQNYTQSDIAQRDPQVIQNNTNNNSDNNDNNTNEEKTNNSLSIMSNKYRMMEKLDEKSLPKTNKFLNMILSSRDVFLKEKNQSWEESIPSEKILGMGQSFNNRNKETSKLIEMDFIDIFYNYGYVGFVIYFSIIMFIFYKLILYFFKNFKKVIENNELFSKYVSVTISVLLSSLAGHFLGAPAVSLIGAIVLSNLFIEAKQNKKTNAFKLNIKKILIIIVVIALSTIVLYVSNAYFSKKFSQYHIDINIDNNSIKIKGGKYTLEKKNSEIVKSEYAQDNITYYTVNHKSNEIMNIILVNRKIKNGVVFRFITGKNIGSKEIILNINNQENFINSYDFNKYTKTKEYSTLVGYDKTSMPDRYYTFKDSFQLQYNTFVYSNISKEYEKNNKSTFKKLEKIYTASIDKNKSIVENIEIKKDEYFDNFTIINESDLFESQNHIDEFIQGFQNNEINTWVSFDGNYTKLPYSIDPFEKDAYGRNLGYQIEKYLWEKNKQNKNILYDSYTLSSVHTLENYIPRYNQSIWLTEYTSTWLDTYGIKSYYVDTRHNDTIAAYLSSISKKYNDEHIKQMSLYYANYLMTEYKNNNMLKTEYGKLFADYYSNHHTKKTHSSLNHQLAIVNYLINSYIETKNEEYKKIAIVNLKTIENIGNKWIKQNGDLFYQMDEKGNFSGEDYKELTLDDLVTTQNLLQKVGIKKSQKLNNLIMSKIKYLNSIDYECSSTLKSNLKVGGYIE